MSYLIDDLDKISHTLVMINGKWYIAKPIGEINNIRTECQQLAKAVVDRLFGEGE